MGLGGLLAVAVVVAGALLWRRAVRAAAREHEREEARLVAALGAQAAALQGDAAARFAAPAPVPLPPLPPPDAGAAGAPDRAPLVKARAWAGAVDPERLDQGSLERLPPAALPAALPLEGADLSGADPSHQDLVAASVDERASIPGAARVQVRWVRSVGAHVCWSELRTPAGDAPGPAREVLCVARVEDGRLAQRWSF